MDIEYYKKKNTNKAKEILRSCQGCKKSMTSNSSIFPFQKPNKNSQQSKPIHSTSNSSLFPFQKPNKNSQQSRPIPSTSNSSFFRFHKPNKNPNNPSPYTPRRIPHYFPFKNPTKIPTIQDHTLHVQFLIISLSIIII